MQYKQCRDSMVWEVIFSVEYSCELEQGLEAYKIQNTIKMSYFEQKPYIFSAFKPFFKNLR